jgi:hypothetical protein
MTFNARHTLIRETRGLLLDFVNSVYPASMADDLIFSVMADLPQPMAEDLVRRDLGYLQARALIEESWAPHPVTRTKVHRWTLTADGVTFVERGKPWDELESP